MEKLIEHLRPISEEILTEDELAGLIAQKTPLNHYIGFEISGQVHLGHASTLLVIKTLLENQVNCHIFLADWHSFINNKLGGNFQNIRQAAKYFEVAMRAAAECFEIDHQQIKFILANEVYDQKYWEIVMQVAKNTTLSRSKRSLDIAGRTAGDSIPTALLFYPAMQAADIFFLKINIAHAGMDQRKAHIVARQANLQEFVKPVAIHSHILQGLSKPTAWPIPKEDRLASSLALKMSKSKPESAIFIHDDPEVIKSKIQKAFCPPKQTEFNPIIDWTINFILKITNPLVIKRETKYGGNLSITSGKQLCELYEQDKLFPLDLKQAVADWLIDFLAPARKYFDQPEPKKLLQTMQQLTVTR